MLNIFRTFCIQECTLSILRLNDNSGGHPKSANRGQSFSFAHPIGPLGHWGSNPKKRSRCFVASLLQVSSPSSMACLSYDRTTSDHLNSLIQPLFFLRSTIFRHKPKKSFGKPLILVWLTMLTPQYLGGKIV